MGADFIGIGCRVESESRAELHRNGVPSCVGILTVEQWYESIGDATFADAILDRLVHNAYKICLTGESMRKKKNKKENNNANEITNPAPVSTR